MVRSETQRELLAARGFRHLDVWPGAVDTSLFRPRGKRALCLPRASSMDMGGVSIEKGLDDFLSLSLIPAQFNVLILMTYPLFVALITWFFLHEQREFPTLLTLLAAALLGALGDLWWDAVVYPATRFGGAMGRGEATCMT